MNMKIKENQMNSTILKPTQRFAQLKQSLTHPTYTAREKSAVQYTLPFQVLYLKRATETRVIEICEIAVRSSIYEFGLNDSPFDDLYRTEILMYSEEGIVTLTLNQELFLPIANQCMNDDPWSLTISAQSRDGYLFKDSKPLFSLPVFDSRSPEKHHFEQLLDPRSETELQPLMIFAQVVASHFWKEEDATFDVYLSEDGKEPAFTIKASSSSSYLLSIA